MKTEILVKCAERAWPEFRWQKYEDDGVIEGYHLTSGLRVFFSMVDSEDVLALQTELEPEWEFTKVDGVVFPVGALKGILKPFQARNKATGQFLYGRTKPELLYAIVSTESGRGDG